MDSNVECLRNIISAESLDIKIKTVTWKGDKTHH